MATRWKLVLNSSALGRSARACRLLGRGMVAVGLALGCVWPAHADLVVNGGFETGDFTGWVGLGNFSDVSVICPGPPFVPLAPEGNCEGQFGPVGSDGTLAQGLNTVAGQTYEISFDFFSDGQTPSDFSVTFGSDLLFSITDPPANGYQTFAFFDTAASPNTTLAFNFRDDPGFLYLDAVAVGAPEPATIALLGIGLGGVFVARRRRAK
jgi:hypothetical protein